MTAVTDGDTLSMLIAGKAHGEDARVGKHVMKVSAKRVPEAVRTLIGYYRDQRGEGEPFGEWALRVGVPGIREFMADFRDMPVYNENPMAFVDWGATKLFNLDDMGEGECAI